MDEQELTLRKQLIQLHGIQSQLSAIESFKKIDFLPAKFSTSQITLGEVEGMFFIIPPKLNSDTFIYRSITIKESLITFFMRLAYKLVSPDILERVGKSAWSRFFEHRNDKSKFKRLYVHIASLRPRKLD